MYTNVWYQALISSELSVQASAALSVAQLLCKSVLKLDNYTFRDVPICTELSAKLVVLAPQLLVYARRVISNVDLRRHALFTLLIIAAAFSLCAETYLQRRSQKTRTFHATYHRIMITDTGRPCMVGHGRRRRAQPIDLQRVHALIPFIFANAKNISSGSFDNHMKNSSLITVCSSLAKQMLRKERHTFPRHHISSYVTPQCMIQSWHQQQY
jgi:hypothetical protein